MSPSLGLTTSSLSLFTPLDLRSVSFVSGKGKSCVSIEQAMVLFTVHKNSLVYFTVSVHNPVNNFAMSGYNDWLTLLMLCWPNIAKMLQTALHTCIVCAHSGPWVPGSLVPGIWVHWVCVLIISEVVMSNRIPCFHFQLGDNSAFAPSPGWWSQVVWTTSFNVDVCIWAFQWMASSQGHEPPSPRSYIDGDIQGRCSTLLALICMGNNKLSIYIPPWCG